MYIGQLGFHILSTPTPPEEGWGRQHVETDVVNIWIGVACDATNIRHLLCNLRNCVPTSGLPQALPERACHSIASSSNYKTYSLLLLSMRSSGISISYVGHFRRATPPFRRNLEATAIVLPLRGTRAAGRRICLRRPCRPPPAAHHAHAERGARPHWGRLLELNGLRNDGDEKLLAEAVTKNKNGVPITRTHANVNLACGRRYW